MRCKEGHGQGVGQGPRVTCSCTQSHAVICNRQCHVITWDWVNSGFTLLTQSHVVMQFAMSFDHMGLGQQWIYCVDPIPRGYVIRNIM